MKKALYVMSDITKYLAVLCFVIGLICGWLTLTQPAFANFKGYTIWAFYDTFLCIMTSRIDKSFGDDY